MTTALIVLGCFVGGTVLSLAAILVASRFDIGLVAEDERLAALYGFRYP
ncbi:MAG TPA: hypothetical protein VF972_06735 [Actinomycetota bacterium]